MTRGDFVLVYDESVPPPFKRLGLYVGPRGGTMCEVSFKGWAIVGGVFVTSEISVVPIENVELATEEIVRGIRW